jgi:hypothetical protein
LITEVHTGENAKKELKVWKYTDLNGNGERENHEYLELFDGDSVNLSNFELVVQTWPVSSSVVYSTWDTYGSLIGTSKNPTGIICASSRMANRDGDCMDRMAERSIENPGKYTISAEYEGQSFSREIYIETGGSLKAE